LIVRLLATFTHDGTLTDKAELAALVQRIKDASYTEDELPDLIDLLKRSTVCPGVSDLIFIRAHR